MQLSDTQLLILVAASQRPDGLAYPFPASAKGDAEKAARSLLRNGFVDRIKPANARADFWRIVRGTGPVTLRINRTGLAALNLDALPDC